MSMRWVDHIGYLSSVGYYRYFMYDGLGICDTLHKKPCRIGPGLCRTSENLG